MPLLLNENIPIASVNKLRTFGHNLVSVSEKMQGATDKDVLEFAHQTQSIIITFDRDYGELIYHHRLPVPADVIYLRFLPKTPEEPAEYLHNLFQQPNTIGTKIYSSRSKSNSSKTAEIICRLTDTSSIQL